MRRALLLTVVAFAGFAFGISGCGDESDEAPGTTAVNTTESVPTHTGEIDTGRTQNDTDTDQEESSSQGGGNSGSGSNESRIDADPYG